MFTMVGPMTTATPCPAPVARESRPVTTNAGNPLVKARIAGTGEAIAELRRISGLTWEQLAGMLRVSRRALHFWATDKQMHPANEQRVHRVLAVLRRIDRGFSSQNRTLLLSPHEDGVMPYDLLRDARYEDVVERLGEGHAPPRPQLPPMSGAERARRRPPAPADLLGAREDNIHVESGRVIRTKPIRRPRRD
jgi:transcriptional regulator with XRE-family HTH domain